MSMRRSVPDEWMVFANSVCLGVRLPAGFRESWSERMSRLLSGVRSSWDMLARNSDLYFDVRRELLGLLFEGLPGLLDFLVLPLHLDVLMREQPRLLLQLFVRILELFLPALQLAGERLGLREQTLRAHVRLDRVNHDADALRELIEEGVVGRVEVIERAQLQHGLDLALEDDGQDDDVDGRRVPESRRDPDVVRRHVGEHDLLALERALSHEPFAQVELLGDRAGPLVSVAGEERELCRLLGRLEDVEDAVLRVHHRRELGQDQAGHGEEVLLALEHAAELARGWS